MKVKKWSTEDKTKLLYILRQHGSLNLQLLQEKLPHKTTEEIQHICNKHMKLAEIDEEEEKKKKKYRAPLGTWNKILRNLNYSKKHPIRNLVPRVLKYIMLFEKREFSSAINLTECYHLLHDMCQGLDLRNLGRGEGHFFRECLKTLSDEARSPGIGGLRKMLRSIGRVEEYERKDMYGKMLNPLGIDPGLLRTTNLQRTFNLFE